MLSLVAEAREEIARQSVPKITPPTPETVDSLRALAGPFSQPQDPLVSGYADARAEQWASTPQWGAGTQAQLQTTAPTIDFSATRGDQPTRSYPYGFGNLSPVEQVEAGTYKPEVDFQPPTLYDVARMEIPYAREVASRAGDVTRELAKASPQLGPVNFAAEQAGLSDVKGADLTPANLAGTAVETAVPIEVWQAALELLPGVGTVPGVISAVRAGDSQAILAVRTALKDERLAPVLARARMALTQGESGQFDLTWLAKKIEDAQKSVDEYKVLRSQRGLDPETRAGLKAEQTVVEQRIAALNDIEARGAPTRPGEHEATAISAIDEEVARIEAELQRRTIPFGGRAGISAAQQRRMIRRGSDSQFTNAFKDLTTEQLNARRTALGELKAELPEGLGAPDVLAPEIAAPEAKQVHGEVLHAGKAVRGTWTEDIATPGRGTFTPDDPNDVTRGRYALGDVRNKTLMGEGDAASGSLPADKLPPPTALEPPAAVFDAYRKAYGAGAEAKMIEDGLIPASPDFAQIKPPVAPNAAARAGADALGLGEPAPPMAEQLHVPVSEIPEPGTIARRFDAKPMTVDEASMSVTEWLRKGEKLRPGQEDMFRAQRSQQAAKMEAAYQAGGDEAHLRAKAAGSGAFQRPEMAPLDLTPEQLTLVRQEINTSGALQTYERTAAHDALDAMLGGRLPQPNQGVQLGKLFGSTFVEQLKQRGGRDYGNALVQIANAPRSLMTMGDLSATLRQSIIVAPAHPILFGKAVGAQFRALKSQSVADALTDAITNHPDFPILEGRVQLLGPKASGLAGHEEGFQAPFLAKIPGIGQVYNATERAYSGMTNKVRWDYAYDQLARWREPTKGVLGTGLFKRDALEITPEMLDNLGLYVNNLTGRGTLPKVLADHAAWINAVFFAPKFLASRAQLIGDLVRPSQSAEVRLMAAKDLGAFVATGVGVMAAMKYFGGVDVELDPRSPKWGKYTVAGQSHDFWAGFGPIARLVAQSGSNKDIIKGKGSQVREGTTGKLVVERDITKLVSNFLRNKLSPTASLGLDLYTQRDYKGQNPREHLADLNFDNPILGRMAPLFVQDAVEAYQAGGVAGLSSAPAAFFGESIVADNQSPESLARTDAAIAKNDLESKMPNADDTFKLPVIQQTFESVGLDPSGYDSMEEYKAAYVETYAPAIAQADGISLPEAQTRAGKHFDAQKPVKDFKASMTNAELYFWRENPKLLDELTIKGIIKPTEAQSRILAAYRQATPVGSSE